MTYQTTNNISIVASNNAAIIAQSISMDEKIMQVERRSYHSFYDVHVIENEDGTYSTYEEGDYDALPMSIIDRIVYSVAGKMSDEY